MSQNPTDMPPSSAAIDLTSAAPPAPTEAQDTKDAFRIPLQITPGSLNFDTEVRRLLAEIIREAQLDRFEIASRMSRLRGEDITKQQIDKWCAQSRSGWNFPFHLAPALEVACYSRRLTQWLAEKRSGRVLFGREILQAELGKLESTRADVTQEIVNIKRLLGETE